MRSPLARRSAIRYNARMAKKPLNIGMIGYGFMGRAHSNAYRKRQQLLRPRISTRCSRPSAAATRRRPRRSPTSGATNRSRPTGGSCIERKDIDAIDICAPNNMHKEIAIAAAKAGKMILCEKPLAMNAAEGEEMVEAVEKAEGAEHGLVQLPPRARPSRSPSSSSTRAGSARSSTYRANFLQDWTISADLPQGGAALWRLDVERRRLAASPATCSPTASTPRIWLNGAIKNVTAMTETFIKERKHNLTGKVEKVGIDDACAFLCRFDNGSLGHVRIDPLRPRPQGPLHLRDQRRERLASSGTCTTCTAWNISTTATKARSAAGAASTSPTATIPTWATGGCPACRSATSTPSSTRSPTSSKASRNGKPAGPDLPRRPRNAESLRRGVILSQERTMGSRAALTLSFRTP